MSDNVTSILNATRGQTASGRGPTDTGKVPYKPVEIASSGYSDTLRVHYSNGEIEIFRYAYARSILNGLRGSISLEFPGGTVVLQGRHLRPLMDAFEHQRAKRVVAFDPDRHERPRESEPLIERIDFAAPTSTPSAGTGS